MFIQNYVWQDQREKCAIFTISHYIAIKHSKVQKYVTNKKQRCQVNLTKINLFTEAFGIGYL